VGEAHVEPEGTFVPEGYLEWVRRDIPAYDELQDRIAAETDGIEAGRVLDLGVGTGETARRVLERHPGALLTGVDSSAGMVERARAELPAERIEELRVRRLEDALPEGPFDLVVSALAVHHLDPAAKADLFRRVAAALSPGGRFVLGDVVLPDRPEDAFIQLRAGFDRPDSPHEQAAWLGAAGLRARIAWLRGDLAVLVADRW
jgi:trans-aconitate methyltransferase